MSMLQVPRMATPVLALLLLAPSAPGEDSAPDRRAAAALELSREPPAVFFEKLAPLLTPLETVLERRGDFDASGKDGIILLDETIAHSDGEGRRLLVYHRVYEALNESGARLAAEDTYSFRTWDQRIHLVEALSLPPGGTALPVADGSVIMESPQGNASDKIYMDRGQMRIIYPGVKPGTVTRNLVVVEELEPRIPGHFGFWEVWGAYWPTRSSRTLLHLPASLSERLRETRLGSGIPKVAKSSAGEDWVVWNYEKERIKGIRAEPGRPPALRGTHRRD